MRPPALLALLVLSCGDNTPPPDRGACPVDPALPESWRLDGDGIGIEIRRAPYAIAVRDARGDVALESLGGGAGDGYAALGWTAGTVAYQADFAPGYTLVSPRLEPWRDDLEVASVEIAGAAIRARLARTGDRDAPCVIVSHTLRRSALRVEARVDGVGPRAWAVGFASPADEGFLGLGERFNRTDQRGVDVYHWTEEGGLGEGEGEEPNRGNPFPHGEAMTYYPVPFFVSTRGYGFWLDTTWRSEMNLATARPDAWRAWHLGPTLAYEVYLPRPADERPWPYHLIDAFTERTGRPLRPPTWAFGPRRRIDRGDRQGEVSELEAMRDLDLAITAVDDAEHFYPAGTHLGIEPALRAWIAEAQRLGYRVNAYYNSMLARRADSALAAFTAQAAADGRFLLGPGGAIPDVWVLTGHRVEELYVVDFTDPATTAWYQDTFAWARDLGYAGWMYDFGEYVQAEVVAASGMSGEELHNLYPVLYARAALDALDGDWFTFMRSGYTGSSAFAPMVWSGDPAASFESADGLPSMPRAAINLGISGAPHWAGDIGGYHCLADGVEVADEELLVRWIQQGSMTSGMQDQDACVGGDQVRKASIWSSPLAQETWRRYARLHTRLAPYLEGLAVVASATGAPVVRHLFLEHPDRPDLRAVDDAYYLGPALLVAPVVVRGDRSKRIALAAGTYLDWDSRALVAGHREATLDAPLEHLPLLLREGHLVPLLDPSIDTLADENHPDVVGPGDVADVYDVVGLVTAAAPVARFRLADGTELRVTRGAGESRVQVSSEPGQTVSAGGMTLENGSTRRVRWDIAVAP